MTSHPKPGRDAPPSGVTRRSLSGWRGNLALGIGAVLASLLLCELLLRILGVSFTVFVWTDPVRGVAHIPGVRGRERETDGRALVEINSDGLRGPEAALDPPSGTFRIALLGDSYIEAFEVPYARTVGEVLEKELSRLTGGPVEVLNFGVGGYGTAQQLLTLRHEVWKYAPDLVLLAITTGNDISDNYRPLKRVDYVPYYVYQGEQLVLDTSYLQSEGYRARAIGTKMLRGAVQHSRLVQLLNRVRNLRRRGERQRYQAGGTEQEAGLHEEVYLPPATPEWQAAWKLTEGLLRLIRDECRTKQTPCAIITLTAGNQVSPQPEKKEALRRRLGVKDLYYPERRLSEFAKGEGIPLLALAPIMAEDAEKRKVFFHSHYNVPGTGHWNPEGHRVAGNLIAAWLAREMAPPARASELRSQR